MARRNKVRTAGAGGLSRSALPRTRYPDRRFRTASVELTGDLRWVRYELMPPDRLRRGLGDAVLQSTPLAEVDWANLFAYMHRRFGPPTLGSDDYKDASAAWLLRSPDPQVFVRVLPSPSGAWNSFLVGVPPALAPSSEGLDTRHLTRVARAYRAVLMDLLRPVCVRDIEINALGRVEDDRLCRHDEKRDEPVYMVDYHESCGRGIPLGVVGEGWPDLLSALDILGDGDIPRGMVQMVNLGRERIASTLRTEPSRVRNLVLACAGDSPQVGELVSAAGPQIKVMREMLFEGLVRNRRVPAWTDEELVRAGRMVYALGGSVDVDEAVQALRMAKRMDGFWIGLSRACRGDFPDEFVPSTDLWTDMNEVSRVIRRIRRGKYPALSAWLGGLLREPDGRETFARMLYRLARAAAERRAGDQDGGVGS